MLTRKCLKNEINDEVVFFINRQYKNTAFRINFLNFLLFALPVALLMLVLCWVWLQIQYNFTELERKLSFWFFWIWALFFPILRLFQLRVDPETQAAQAVLKAMLIKQYKDLGKPK